jgi:hypothetical protein
MTTFDDDDVPVRVRYDTEWMVDHGYSPHGRGECVRCGEPIDFWHRYDVAARRSKWIVLNAGTTVNHFRQCPPYAKAG